MASGWLAMARTSSAVGNSLALVGIRLQQRRLSVAQKRRIHLALSPHRTSIGPLYDGPKWGWRNRPTVAQSWLERNQLS
jgi:hypothetical protein